MNQNAASVKGGFFTRDPAFYKALLSMMIVVALQKLVAYSVNMIDNVMLGSYSQDALSGAATVNQVFFMVQCFANAIGNALSVLGAQYWGEKRLGPIRALTGVSLVAALVFSVLSFTLCALFPEELLGLFTTSPAIIAQGVEYLDLIKWSFVLFILSTVLTSALRSVGVVRITFWVSLVSLLLNAGINYTLIFGRFGFPEMGVRGAAVGTVAARAVELAILLVYMVRQRDRKLLGRETIRPGTALTRDYIKIFVPIMLSQVLWGVSVPMQTAILGHLSDAAIAANSVATTFYSYLKVVVQAVSATNAVLIGNAIGRGEMESIRAEGRTLSVISLAVGMVMGAALYLLRQPLLSLYNLTPEATALAGDMIALMSVIMVFMSYQMPVCFGVLQGGGDTRFCTLLNTLSIWLVVMPLSFAAAFWWKLPVLWVVLVIQSDQIFKCLPVFLRFRGYRWIKKLTN